MFFMFKAVTITGRDPVDFIREYNRVNEELLKVGEVFDHQILSATSAQLFYKIKEETETETVPEPKGAGRVCCECVHYKWAQKCKISDRKCRDLKTPACEWFSCDPADEIPEEGGAIQ